MNKKENRFYKELEKKLPIVESSTIVTMPEPNSKKSNMNFYLLEEIDPQTGLYNQLGISSNENLVEDFLEDSRIVKRIQIFGLARLDGPIKIINSLEEFMEFQK